MIDATIDKQNLPEMFSQLKATLLDNADRQSKELKTILETTLIKQNSMINKVCDDVNNRVRQSEISDDVLHKLDFLIARSSNHHQDAFSDNPQQMLSSECVGTSLNNCAQTGAVASHTNMLQLHLGFSNRTRSLPGLTDDPTNEGFTMVSYQKSNNQQHKQK